MPKYNEIRLSINVWPRVSNLIKSIKPDAIHIATEGPLGFMARRYCIKKGLKFTTSFHTRFDKYHETLLCLLFQLNGQKNFYVIFIIKLKEF